MQVAYDLVDLLGREAAPSLLMNRIKPDHCGGVLGPRNERLRECVCMATGASSTTTALQGAMPSPLLRRLLCNGFETVPLALLIQMTTLFTEGVNSVHSVVLVVQALWLLAK